MNILLICNRPRKNTNASALISHLDSFSEYSKHDVYEFNPTIHDCNSLRLEGFNLIIIHYSIVMCMNVYMPLALRRKVHAYKGIKVVFIQDEYRHINNTIDVLNSLDIDILYTNFPESEINLIYHESKLPGVKKINCLTGYVPDYLKNISYPDYDDRKVDVSYRCREIPAWLGELGREKITIGNDFPKYAKKYGLICDISCIEQGRLYGELWERLLKTSKSSLGTETGASVMDFTGEIQKNVEEHIFIEPNVPFSKLKRLYFSDEEGKHKINQISPRCFEYAAFGTMMVLFEGEYLNILKPWVHYIPLAKNFDNIKEVVDAIKNKDLWKKITQNARRDLILSEKYSYKIFMRSFYETIYKHAKYINYNGKSNIVFKPVVVKKLYAKYFFIDIKVIIAKLLYKSIPSGVFQRIKYIFTKLRTKKVAGDFDSLTLQKRLLENIDVKKRVFYKDVNENIIFCSGVSSVCYKKKNIVKNLTAEELFKNGKNKVLIDKFCDVCKYHFV